MKNMANNLFNAPGSERPPLQPQHFWLALVAQFLLLATVPAQAIYTLTTGTTVFLQTAPVDPYDVLRGYYQVLSYDISRVDQLAKLPGGEQLPKNQSTTQEIFVTLALPSRSGRQAAKPIAVSRQLPSNLPANQVAIRGISNGWQVKYDLEKFYMPEAEQQTINDNINRNRQQQNLLVEVKVDHRGHPVPVSLWVDNKNYRF